MTDAVITATEKALNAKAREQVVYWAGVATEEANVVLTCVVPAAITSRYSFRTTVGVGARLVGFLARSRLQLLAQLHTHPDDLVDHSPVDDAGAFLPYEGFLSIVVPNYGKFGLNLSRCGVHEFKGGSFYRMDGSSASRLVSSVPSVTYIS